jgi:hypothetical protein
MFSFFPPLYGLDGCNGVFVPNRSLWVYRFAPGIGVASGDVTLTVGTIYNVSIGYRKNDCLV